MTHRKSAAVTTASDAAAQRSPAILEKELVHPPLVPDFILREQNCLLGTDTRFRAAARLLAALWRQERNLPIGNHVDPTTGKSLRGIKIGSRISQKAAASGATFMSPEIAAYTREILLFREPGSVWEEGRLWGNLLSSQTLTLNLLAPMAIDLDLATRIWQRILPNFVQAVTSIRFEHSPGRFAEHYFGDGTAMDAIIDIVTPDGELAFVAIEVKYVEDMLGKAATHRPRYDETTRECGLFSDPESDTLRRPGFEQLRREHVLSQMMVDRGLASRGHFVLIGPRLNRRVNAAAVLYEAELLDPTGQHDHTDGRQRVGFEHVTVEAILTAMAEAGAVDLSAKLYARYCDFHRVVRHVLDRFAKVPVAASFDPSNRTVSNKSLQPVDETSIAAKPVAA